MRRWISAAVIAAMATAGVSLVTGGPASAGGGCGGGVATAPNGRMRVNGGPFEGQNSFGNEVVFADVPLGTQALYQAKFKNSIPTEQPQKIKVILDRYHNPGGYRIKYFVDGVNVSKQLRSGESLVFPNIAIDKSTPFIEVVVKNVANTELDPGDFVLRGLYGGTPIGTLCEGLAGVFNPEL
jgi:hypothetical protein